MSVGEPVGEQWWFTCAVPSYTAVKKNEDLLPIKSSSDIYLNGGGKNDMFLFVSQTIYFYACVYIKIAWKVWEYIYTKLMTFERENGKNMKEGMWLWLLLCISIFLSFCKLLNIFI